MSEILWEVVPDMRTKIGERAKAVSFAVEASMLRVSDEERREREGLYSCSSSERSEGAVS